MKMNTYLFGGVVFVALGILFVLVYQLKTRTAFFNYYYGKNKVKEISDIKYKSGSDNPKNLLDLYLPKDKKQFPVVVFIHGGYWTSGDKKYNEWLTGLYGNLGIALAKDGIGVAIANYRLYPEAGIEDQLDDVSGAVAWVQQHAHEYGSNGQLFLMGHSAGGHLVSLLGTQPERLARKGVDAEKIRGYISLSGVWDIADMVKNQSDDFNENTAFPLFGRDPSGWPNYSPAKSISQITAPFFIGIGGKDYAYLMAQAKNIDAEMTSNKVTHEYVVLPGYTHIDMVIKFGSKGDLLEQKVVQFINKNAVQ